MPHLKVRGQYQCPTSKWGVNINAPPQSEGSVSMPHLKVRGQYQCPTSKWGVNTNAPPQSEGSVSTPHLKWGVSINTPPQSEELIFTKGAHRDWESLGGELSALPLKDPAIPSILIDPSNTKPNYGPTTQWMNHWQQLFRKWLQQDW